MYQYSLSYSFYFELRFHTYRQFIQFLYQNPVTAIQILMLHVFNLFEYACI
jgi:hypothetical protein